MTQRIHLSTDIHHRSARFGPGRIGTASLLSRLWLLMLVAIVASSTSCKVTAAPLADVSVGNATDMGAVDSDAAQGDAPLTTVRVATGLVRPLFVTAPRDDFDRIFIVEQSGRIRIVKDGVLLTDPFLDIRSIVGGIETFMDERGLLGLVFDPDYPTNGFFYVNYTDNADNTMIVRYRVSDDPDLADAQSDQVILSIPQPFQNHNGGWMDFGPDGFLYIASGDGGNREDPDNHAQTRTDDLLGKMLRIDVRGDDFPADLLRNYRIPPDNPFVEESGDDEIWAYGLRNPWRCAFDRQTGALYITDVGQDEWEELNVEPAGHPGGSNYGWRCMEADACTGLTGCVCDDVSLTAPIHAYDHRMGCSITGGYVYRGCAIPDLRGTYFFADFCSDRIWSFRYAQGSIDGLIERSDELSFAGQPIESISSFGQDAYGELYICSHRSGEVFKIVPALAAPDCNDNGTPDGCDIADGTSRDDDADGVPDTCGTELRIIAADPPDGAVDARQPNSMDGSQPAGWQGVVLSFSGDGTGLIADDFAVDQLGVSVESPPVAVSVTPVDASRYAVTLDRPLDPCTWTIMTHRPSGSSIRLGFVPGDVNGDGYAGVLDILVLVDTLNGVVQRPIWAADINRSGAVEPGDVLRLVDILNRVGSFASLDDDCSIRP